ncbi:MAG: CHRD domain-containing protein [Chitinophagaceae bacterium]
MKQFFLPAMICSFVFFAACNNEAGTSENNNADADSMADNSSTSNMGNGSNDVMMKQGITLSSSQEVPANSSTATGTADVSYNKSTQMLTYTVNWNSLTAAPSMAHIHGTAPKGTNAGVKHNLTPLLSKAVSGNFTDSVKVDGTMIKEDSLLAGFYYFNFHTPANPGGEIRGQIEF